MYKLNQQCTNATDLNAQLLPLKAREDTRKHCKNQIWELGEAVN